VVGKVVYPDGSPVPGGTVVFQPADGDTQPSARGEIQPDGTFRLGTQAPEDGAPPGKYRVAVLPPHRSEEDARRKPPAVDPAFGDFATSGLEYTIQAGRKNEFLITVTRPEMRKR
jgi:hypothetical protein